MTTTPRPVDTSAPVDIAADDLQSPGVVYCPNPKMALWSTHPRVFLDVGATGQAKCPYCGTVYRLAPGAAMRVH